MTLYFKLPHKLVLENKCGKLIVLISLSMLYSLMTLFLGLSGLIHDFHVSVCDIEYDDQRHLLKITHRIFIDDLEETLVLQNHDSHINLLNTKKKNIQDSLIGSYLTKSFKVKVNEKPIEMDFLGTQIKDDVMLAFTKSSSVKKIKTIEIKNITLMELFLDQINLIHFRSGDFKQSLKLDSSSQVGLINLK